VRDGLDLRRAYGALALALLPCVLVGVPNLGWQVLSAVDVEGLDAPPGWRGAALGAVGLGDAVDSPLAWWLCGLLHLLPTLLVAVAVGLFWQRVFAARRDRGPDPGVTVMMAMLALLLPPAMPLWQVAIGVSFAVVVGIEIFGGLGRNVVHPVIVGFTFLYFTYPASFSTPGVWVGVPDAEAMPVLQAVAQDGIDALNVIDPIWRDTLVGWEPGALGETSALACALGAAWLVFAGLASWRIVAGGVLGLVGAAGVANALGDPGRAAVGLPASWHLTTGSFAFALAFLATDPVTSPLTAAGRFVHGVLIGALVILIRVFNPAQPEGVPLALLLANVLAPLIDHVAVRVHVLRRRRRG
jgi:Na+-transporting NADH:ubiquinone oxidoreductase subunit B